MTFANILFLLIIQPIYSIIETFFLLFYEIFDNIGIAIVGVSFIVTLLCLPLYMIAEKWQETERQIQIKLKPGITRIKSVFKGDEQFMILQTYYKQNQYHPLMALRSSFSLLIQIPFFIAAYTYLSKLDLLHGYSFLFIKDFGLPDETFKIGNFAINVLPIAMTLINCISGAIYSKGHDFKEKIQIYGCALVFLILLYNSPSGLVIYWTMNNIFSLLKNVFYKIKNPKKVLYIISCIAAVLLIILPFTILSSQKFKIKLLLIFCGIFIPLIPFLIKLLDKFFTSNFKFLENDSNLEFKIFFISAITIAIIIGLVIPSMLISSEADNFCYVDNYKSPYVFIYSPLFQALGLFVLWPCCLYFLFGKKTKKVMALIFPLVLFFSLINTFLFSGKYGPLEKNLKFMTDQTFLPGKWEFLLNLIILIAVAILVIFLLNKFPKILNKINYIFATVLTLFSFINITNINKTYTNLEEPKLKTSIEPIYHLSKDKKNVIVIMQDRCFMPYISEIFENFPDIKETFEGFTFYPNTTSFGHLTMVGSPGIFGGYDYTPFEINKRTDQTLQEKHNQALLTMPILFNKIGFDVTVSNLPYENYLEAPVSQMYDNYPFVRHINTHGVYSDLWYSEKNIEHKKHTAIEIKRNMFWFGLFKIVPPVLRKIVYHDSYWNSMEYSLSQTERFINNYTPVYYFNDLTDFTNEKSSFILIDNEMVHDPIKLEPPLYLPENSLKNEKKSDQPSDEAKTTMISLFKNYSRFLTYLKENNVYDNTRIIIVSDHGMEVESNLFNEHDIGGLKKEQVIATLLVKDFNDKGNLKVDDSFMTNADTPSIALENLIANPKNPFTGNNLKVNDKAKYTKITMGDAESTLNRRHTQFKINDNQWSYVKDNIYIDSNWTKLSEEEIKKEFTK